MKKSCVNLARSAVALVVLAGCLVACQSSSGTGDTTREQCVERFWDDQDGDGWGECISEETLLGGITEFPQQNDSCDGTDSCFDSGNDYPDESMDDSEQFDPYWNGREMVECAGDYWGDEPCG